MHIQLIQPTPKKEVANIKWRVNHHCDGARPPNLSLADTRKFLLQGRLRLTLDSPQESRNPRQPTALQQIKTKDNFPETNFYITKGLRLLWELTQYNVVHS